MSSNNQKIVLSPKLFSGNRRRKNARSGVGAHLDFRRTGSPGRIRFTCIVQATLSRTGDDYLGWRQLKDGFLLRHKHAPVNPPPGGPRIGCHPWAMPSPPLLWESIPFQNHARAAPSCIRQEMEKGHSERNDSSHSSWISKAGRTRNGQQIYRAAERCF